jgi:hypothetical protein
MTNNFYKRQLNTIRKLVLSGDGFADSFGKIEQSDLPNIYLYTTIRKTTNLLRSIHHLVSVGQVSDAQILARVLIEVKINLAYLEVLVKKEGDRAFLRVLDAIMISRNKAVVNADWGVGYQKAFTNWTGTMAIVKSHFPTDEYAAIRRFGMFGCNIEERARRTKNSGLYNHAYRLYSKSVHGLDMNEILAEYENNYSYQASRAKTLLASVPVFASSIFLTCRTIQRNRTRANRPERQQRGGPHLINPTRLAI